MSGLSLLPQTDDDATPNNLDASLRKQPLDASSRPVFSGLSSLIRDFASRDGGNIEFQSTTVAPSPPSSHVQLQDTYHTSSQSQPNTANALRISTTDLSSTIAVTPGISSHRDILGTASSNSTLSPCRIPSERTGSTITGAYLARTPSFKNSYASSYGMPSPIINAMGDVTPLPSPLMSSDSPGPWKLFSNGAGAVSPPSRRDRLSSLSEEVQNASDSSISNSISPDRKLFLDTNISETTKSTNTQSTTTTVRHHTRNRSISDYTPDSNVMHKRPVVVSGSHPLNRGSPQEPNMRREMNLAESRGLTPTVSKPPTPPPSESSRDAIGMATRNKDSTIEYFKAKGRYDDKRRRWRSLGLLGRGTFSRVMLATSQITPSDDTVEIPSGVLSDCRLDRKTLVAVKVCEHGPRGGASEDRVEMSLKRELEIMQVIHHPSLVDLKAWSIEPTRAILVMSYCPGGDLFDIATTSRDILTEALIRRIFGELVAAVHYLHEKSIVHRDIKLENVLVNMRPGEMANESINWATYPHAVITLADLGLSRRITKGEQLETRCGSDDYAAPEVIMGQPYDGNATDAWSLGVLLYALLEARLPFDPHPGMSDAHRMRSRTSHRVARVEWRWVEYGGDDGDHEANESKFKEDGLVDAMRIVEGLLKRARSRWTLEKVASQKWVSDALQVPGGLRFREEDDGEVVS